MKEFVQEYGNDVIKISIGIIIYLFCAGMLLMYIKKK
jgi:hypothetical protein